MLGIAELHFTAAQDVVVEHGSLSRQHAAISSEGTGILMLTDLASGEKWRGWWEGLHQWDIPASLACDNTSDAESIFSCSSWDEPRRGLAEAPDAQAAASGVHVQAGRQFQGV